MHHIEEVAHRHEVDPETLDTLLSQGWRHFGILFFRTSMSVMGGVVHQIIPLRCQVDRFVLRKSLRRVMKKNSDVEVEVGPASITAEKEALFVKHRERFEDNVPESLLNFLSPQPANRPCQCLSIDVRLDGKLVAASYLDVGRFATSAVYGIFDPDEHRRSLGIYTMLVEAEISRERGAKHYYLGYGTVASSHYDYKRTMPGVEAFDWVGKWAPIGPVG